MKAFSPCQVMKLLVNVYPDLFRNIVCNFKIPTNNTSIV